MIKNESLYEKVCMGQSTTRAITAHVPLEMVDKLDELAAQYDCSRGYLIRQAVQAMIDREELHYQMTLEALAAVEDGSVVAHDDVLQWANSLSTETPLTIPKSGRR